MAVIWGRSMTGALAIFPVCVEGDVGNTGRNLQDIHAALEQEHVQGQNPVFTGSDDKNNSGLGKIGGADLGGGRRLHKLIETAAFRCVVHDGNGRGGVDDHQTGSPDSS